MDANISNVTRKAVYRRDGYRCTLCDCSQTLQVHHVIPRCQDGGNTEQNLVTLCSVCHAQIHGHLLEGDLEQGHVEQAAVEYLADFYAPDWDPWRRE